MGLGFEVTVVGVGAEHKAVGVQALIIVVSLVSMAGMGMGMRMMMPEKPNHESTKGWLQGNRRHLKDRIGFWLWI